MKLGQLKEVDIRELWKHEQYDFSKWLSSDTNIEYLNEVLGLTLVDIDTEVYVGSYRCDIVAKDETTDTKIIIENQLEATNHDHLGKTIVYASGLDAQVVVWIVKEARSEHKAAIEWLNNNTNKHISFFLIEIHAYTIGDSLPAPYFKVIEQPNDFVKNTKGISSKDGELNKSQAERLEFWSMFNEVVVERGKPFNVRKATTDHWYDVSLGTSLAHVGINLVNKNSNVCVEIYINDSKELFDQLHDCKDEIEALLNIELTWDRLDGKKASRIKSYIAGLNFDDHSNYSTLMNQIIDRAVLLRDTFKKYI